MVYTNEWESWEKDKLGDPYRIGFLFRNGCQESKEWHADVMVTDLTISQDGKATTIDGFPERLEFEEIPTVSGTPRRHNAGRFLEQKYNLNFEHDASVVIGFQIPAGGVQHTAKFEFEPHLRKGLFRPID